MRAIRAVLLLALALLLACAPGGGEEATLSTDTPTRRQKDSIAGTLPIPGARGIRRALEVSDSAAARARRHDSLR